MAIPLPQGDYSILDAVNEISKASKGRLQNELNRLQNQYYGPNIESQIAERNALTEGYNIANQYAPERLGLANEINRQNLEYNKQINPLKIEQQKLANQYAYETNPLKRKELEIKVNNLDEEIKAKIASQKSIANWRNSGGLSGGVDLKARQGFNRQLQIDHPDWTPEKLNDASNAYFEGRDTFSNGEPLPPLGGQAKNDLTKIQSKNAPAAVRNQAANMDILAGDLNDINFAPLSKFSGPRGKAEFSKNFANMLKGNPVTQDFREYLAFKDVTSQFAMDALRKGFGTSVVPGYVYATLGKASNPASSFWNDPEQALLEWNKVKEWVNNNAERLKIKVRKGVTENVSKINKNKNKNDLSQLSDEELRRIINGK